MNLKMGFYKPQFLTLAGMFTVLIVTTSPAAAERFDFQSPSGNIHCEADDDPNEGGIRCDILEVNSMSFSEKPDDCNLDWGKSFYLGTVEMGKPYCNGDTIVNPNSPVLEYGTRRLFGDYLVCFSEKTGMECQNNRGFGFSISRDKQSVY